ncbi:hypothetical protein [Streptomyces sp. NBC_01304]|uniref:hypothetical protein n=1 Tax=Streptomyces sp. NBC_01304 TaxID=2903818 RepID=UPI002E16751D|nr:hypothetical protein OG430_48770 [Streptomyces sp. NBC_01304]
MATSTATKQPATRVRRGDLVIVEMSLSHIVGTPGRNLRTVPVTEYAVMMVTNLYRDGRIKMVRDIAWGDDSAPQMLDGMLHATGKRLNVPQSEVDVEGVAGAARAHTYPNTTTPRRFPSLDAVREALTPHRTYAADTAGITRDAVTDAVHAALQWLPIRDREPALSKPASEVLGAEVKRARKIWIRLSKEGGRIPVETQAMNHYFDVQKLHKAARAFEAQDAKAA